MDSVDSIGPRTLSVDIGGTGMKMLVLDARGRPITERLRQLTPRPPTPENLVAQLAVMARLMPQFDRASVGFPGVVQRGIVRTAPNLGTTTWHGHDLAASASRALGVEVRVINDADLQGYGVVFGAGVELVLTLGTGMGAALFTDGHLVHNLELGHHPFEKSKTYEQRVCDSELTRIGKLRWSERVLRAINQLQPIFNCDLLHIGGGNAKKLRGDLPANVRIFTSESGLSGGVRLWDLSAPRTLELAPPPA